MLTIAGFAIGLGTDRTRRTRNAAQRADPVGNQVAVGSEYSIHATGNVTIGAGGPIILTVGSVVMVAVIAGLIAGVALSGGSDPIAAHPASDPSTAVAPQGNDTTTSTPAPAAPALGIATAWPFITGCGSLAEVAMPPGMGRIEDFHAVTDIRQTLTSSGAGSWTRGMLYLDLSTAGDPEVEIINIQPHIERRDLAPPAWIYRPADGCGPYDSDRIFNFDLDKPSFVDKGLFDNSDAGHPPSPDIPTEPLGPGFVLGNSKHARIRVNVSSCRGNYEWNLDVQYVTAGSNKIEHRLVGPFQSFGVANNTKLYTGYQDATGVVHIEQESQITGSERDSPKDSTGPFFSC